MVFVTDNESDAPKQKPDWAEQNVYISKLFTLFIPTQPRREEMKKQKQKKNAIDPSSHDLHPNLDSNQSRSRGPSPLSTCLGISVASMRLTKP